MNSKLTLLLFCALLSQTLYSQIQSFDLNSYIRPEIKRQTLVFTGNLHANHINNRNQPTTKHNYTSLNLRGNHSAFWDKKKSQIYVNSYAGLEWSIKDGKSNGKGNISSDFISRNYLKNGNSKLYWAGKMYAQGRFKQLEGDNSAIAQPKVGIGYGRTNVISDVWHTIQMIKTLQKEGYIEQLSHEKITELANKVTEIRNMRVLDFRMSKIAQLDALAQAMEELGIVNKVNYQIANRLQDAFIYEGFARRVTGWRFEGGMGSRHIFNNNYKSNSMLFYADFYKSKALTQNTQLTYHANVDYFVKNKILNTSAGVSYGWYPNARTNLTAGIRTRYSHSPNFNSLSLNGDIDLNYFISPKFQFEVNITPRISLIESKPPVILANQFNLVDHLARVNFSYFIF